MNASCHYVKRRRKLLCARLQRQMRVGQMVCISIVLIAAFWWLDVLTSNVMVSCLVNQALRKQVSTYAKEGEELREQIDSLHEERRQLLREKQELQRRQSNGDAEKGDEANMEVDSDDNDDDSRTGGSQRRSSRRAKDRKSPKLVVDPEALENLQQENDTLRTLNESLEQQVNQLTSDVEDSLKEKKVLKQKWEAERINLEKSLKDIFETQKKDLVREKEEFAMRSEYSPCRIVR